MISVGAWDLQVTFRDKSQARDFIKEVLDDEIDYEIVFNKTLTTYDEYYTVQISGNWGNNLVHVAKAVEKVDYKPDNTDMCED